MVDAADLERSLCARQTEPAESPAELCVEIFGEARDHVLILLDPHGRIVSWHQGAREVLGYEPAEIMGTHCSRLYPSEAVAGAWPELELQLATAQGRFSGEGWRVRRNGSRFWASVGLVAVRDRAGELRGFGMLAREMGQRKRSRLLESSEESAHRMLAWLSNELRNPLAPLCSAIDLMQRKHPSDSEFERWLEILQRQCAHLTQLADTMLDLSQTAGGALRLQRQEVDFTVLLRRAFEDCRAVMRAQGQVLRIELPQQPLRLWGDPARLLQVLRTLVLGSIQRAATGAWICLSARTFEGELEVRLEKPGEPVGGRLKSDIALDSGVELTKEVGSAERCVGLTLVLAREVLQLHGGSLELRGVGDGLGGEFVMRLPLWTSPPGGREREQSDPVAEGAIKKKEEVAPARLDRHFVLALHLDALHRLLSSTVLPFCGEAVFSSPEFGDSVRQVA